MAISAIGTLAEFNPREDQNVASYVERVELFCEANNIVEEKQKVAVFLTAVGPKTYEILSHHCKPKSSKEKTFKEIVTLFKQQLGSNTSQHSLPQAKADESAAQDPEGQAKTNKLSTDSAEPQPQGKKPLTFEEVVGKHVSETRKKQGSQNPESARDEWEPSLTYENDELMALQELGLGVAIDITAKHPWVTKSAFQAKQVKKEELIVINESNKSHREREQVETYTSIQQGLESSFRPDPTTPINVTVAADFHRSDTRSKTIDSKTILTRTVAFQAREPLGRGRDEESKENFEKRLHEWLVKKKCYPVICGEHKSNKCGLYSETTNHHCIDYLKELGGVTHYVSSITLGATRYQVILNSTLFNSLSASSEVSAHTIASASTKSKASRKVFQSQSKEQNIGKLPEGTGTILQFRTKGEAVVKCSYNSLSNLVSHPQLRKLLEMGINEYIDLKKNGTRGPYHIATAELLSSKDRKGHRKRLYWTTDWNSPISAAKSNQGENQEREYEDDHSCAVGNRCKILCTANKEEASNFYMKPIVQCGHDKYFWIITDPEDHDSKPQADEGYDKSLVAPLEPQSDKCVPQSKRNREPPRHVSAYNNSLVVELNINPHSAKKSAFKLKNPRDDQTYPLQKSHWLPEALRGSQPYLIGREGKPFRSRIKNNKVWSVYVKNEDDTIMCGHHQEGIDGYGFFILVPGHKT